MDSLAETEWDVIIAGTGLPQSLLALSLSRAGKNILHLDRNEYYGGNEAALSLQEVEKWVKEVEDGHHSSFSHARIVKPSWSNGKGPIGPSRAYTLTLAPQILYAQSAVLPTLVSSRVYTQLEFQAMGPWWISTSREHDSRQSGRVDAAGDARSTIHPATGILQRIPSGREDVFADESLSARDRRALMKYLRSALQEPEPEDSSHESGISDSLETALVTNFNISPALHKPLLALSLLQEPVGKVDVKLSSERIRRHMRSIGVLGPGFGSVIPRYGGVSEIAQVACRAGAVGGSVFVLGQAVLEVSDDPGRLSAASTSAGNFAPRLKVKLSSGEEVNSAYVVGGCDDLPPALTRGLTTSPDESDVRIARCIAIVSSPLSQLFLPSTDLSPVPAGAFVVFGDDTKPSTGRPLTGGGGWTSEGLIYLLVHSSDTGECPIGQCVIYGSTLGSSEDAQDRLAQAVKRLIEACTEDATASLLWSLSYVASGPRVSKSPKLVDVSGSGRIMTFPAPAQDLVFDDHVLDNVKTVWTTVMGAEADDAAFMRFEDRPGMGAWR